MIEQQPALETTVPMETTVLRLSDAAATKLRELTKEETNPNIGLRVYV
jgi:Fe-S cluster assembly iron-binding protein IscA